MQTDNCYKRKCVCCNAETKHCINNQEETHNGKLCFRAAHLWLNIHASILRVISQGWFTANGDKGQCDKQHVFTGMTYFRVSATVGVFFLLSMNGGQRWSGFATVTIWPIKPTHTLIHILIWGALTCSAFIPPLCFHHVWFLGSVRFYFIVTVFITSTEVVLTS